MPIDTSNNFDNWPANVRGLATTDQLEGGVGGVMNFQVQDLTDRTNWLKKRLWTRPIGAYVTVSNNISITAADIGKAYIFASIGSGVTQPKVTLPPVAGVEDGAGFLFIYEDDSPTKMGAVAGNGSEIIRVGRETKPIVYSKPGRGSFWVVKDGSRWRLLGDNPLEDVGFVSAFARAEPPDGWLLAGGQTLSRALYADLYAIIGDVFGAGDGSTTFQLPLLDNQFIRGWEQYATSGFRAFGSVQDATKINGHVGTQPGTSQLALAVANADSTESYSMNGRDGTNLAGSITFTRSTVRPKNIALLYCIKY